MYKLVFSCVLLIIVLTGCSTQVPSPISPAQGSVTFSPSTSDRVNPSDRVPRISVSDLFQKINDKQTLLIVDSRVDVNEQFANGHIVGAIPVPLAQVLSGEWVPPSDKNLEIIFYCT